MNYKFKHIEKTKLTEIWNQNLHIKTEAMETCRINIHTVITETDGNVNRTSISFALHTYETVL